MPYSRITASRYGNECLSYALNGSGHTAGKRRNLLVGRVGFLPDSVQPLRKQYEHLWKHASAKNKNQVRRVIVSFSEREIPSDSSDSAVKAMQILMELSETYFNGFPCTICIQNDGKGGKLHGHLIFSNVSAIDYKGFTDDMTKHWYLKKAVDEVCSKFFELDTGQHAYEKVSQSERRKREENDNISKENEKLPVDEQKPLFYIWKDDLKERIRESMAEATGREDYLKRLAAHGVEGTYKSTKGNGDFILYELIDTTGFDGKIPNNLKAKSYKLGQGFGIEALDELVVKNSRKRVQEPNMTIEEKSKIKKEADDFLNWCNQNNIVFMNEGVMDLDVYEDARTQYEMNCDEVMASNDNIYIETEIETDLETEVEADPVTEVASTVKDEKPRYEYHSRKLRKKNENDDVPIVPNPDENNSDSEPEKQLIYPRKKRNIETREQVDIQYEKPNEITNEKKIGGTRV